MLTGTLDWWSQMSTLLAKAGPLTCSAIFSVTTGKTTPVPVGTGVACSAVIAGMRGSAAMRMPTVPSVSMTMCGAFVGDE